VCLCPPARLVPRPPLPRNCWESTGGSKVAKDEKKLFKYFLPSCAFLLCPKQTNKQTKQTNKQKKPTHPTILKMAVISISEKALEFLIGL